MKKLFLIGLLSFGLSPLVAHHPDEISYFLDIDKDKSSLTIHLTPLSAVELIRSLHPELKEVQQIKTASYYQDITAYFQETIRLEVGEKLLTLSFRQADFLNHDATLVLDINGDYRPGDSLRIQLTSFTEIYRSPVNTVFFNVYGQQAQCELRGSRDSCSLVSGKAAQSSDKAFYLGLILSIAGLGCGSFFFLRYKK